MDGGDFLNNFTINIISLAKVQNTKQADTMCDVLNLWDLSIS